MPIVKLIDDRGLCRGYAAGNTAFVFGMGQVTLQPPAPPKPKLFHMNVPVRGSYDYCTCGSYYTKEVLRETADRGAVVLNECTGCKRLTR